jgi:hypothetical protein
VYGDEQTTKNEQPTEGDQPTGKSGRRPATFLAAKEWPDAGGWLEQSIGLTKTELLNRLADEGITSSSNRLNSYFTGKRLPEPSTLEAICEAAQLSYIEAVDRFGYYREIVTLFDDLVWLGARWLEEDDARGGTLGPLGEEPTRLDSLRNAGVICWKGEPIMWGGQLRWRDKPGDPRSIPEFRNRYIVGSWCELEHRSVSVKFPPIEVVPGSTFSSTFPGTLDRVDPSLNQESLIVPDHTVLVVLPKPIGIALLLATLAFPLRGDGYKEGSPEYRFDLGNAADGLVREARALRTEVRAVGRPKNLHPLLQRACDALDDRSIPFNYRRPTAAEYVVIWASAICGRFTHYARLAAFDFWGEPSGHSWTTTVVTQYGPLGTARQVRMPRPSAFAMMPQAKLAELPEIEPLTTYE